MNAESNPAESTTEHTAKPGSDALWLRWAMGVNIVLAGLSVWRTGTPAAFEHLAPYGQATIGDLALAFAQFPALSWLMMRLFKLALERAGVRRFPAIARHLLGVVLHALMLALAVRVVFDQSLETVVAASGVITVVLGFALRGLVADLFSGIVLSVDRDIGVDDIVEFTLKGRQVIGQIIEFNWRTFKIRDLNQHIMLIPNSEFSSLMVINHSRSGSGCPCTLRFPLPARCDSEKALRVLRGALQREVQAGRIQAHPHPHVEIAAAAPGSLAFEAHFLPRPPHTEYRVVGSLYEAGLHDLGLAGLVLAVPGDSIATSIAATSPQASVSNTPMVRALGRVGLLSVLTDAQRAQLVHHIKRHDQREGTVVVDEGQTGDSMFLILEGACEVQVSHGAHWRHVAHLWPGDHFGEMSLLTGKPRSARVRMQADGVLLELPKQALLELFTGSPELLASVSACVVERGEGSEAIRRRVDPQAQTEHASRVEALVLQMRRFFGLGVG